MHFTWGSSLADVSDTARADASGPLLVKPPVGPVWLLAAAMFIHVPT